MEKYVTGNVAINLYWLGRYLYRAEMILRAVDKTYDEVIDVDVDAGVKLYDKFDVELSYSGAKNFLKEALFGDHNSNMVSILTYARENAIICRHLLDDEAFGEIIELHRIFSEIDEDEADYKLLDHGQSLIGEIWNARSRRQNQELSDKFFTIGKLVEEADYRIRFEDGENDDIVENIISGIDSIAVALMKDHDKEFQASTQKEATQDERLNELNAKIDQIITG